MKKERVSLLKTEREKPLRSTMLVPFAMCRPAAKEARGSRMWIVICVSTRVGQARQGLCVLLLLGWDGGQVQGGS